VQQLTPPVTVVIAAHNESAVIERGLTALLSDAEPGEFQVLVVSNGTTDDTVRKARAAGERLSQPIEVVELPEASKIAALRTADKLLLQRGEPPRIYLDADVLLSTDAARRLTAALAGDAPRMSLARICVDTSTSSWLVRQYYRTWTSTAYINRQDAGSGVFALNAAARRRIGELPDVINDDGYVARHFSGAERAVCDTTFVSFAARDVRSLVRRRARIVNGNRQLDTMLPNPESVGSPGMRAQLRSALREGRTSISAVVVFVAVTAAARALAAWRRRVGKTAEWSTDTTTRGVRGEP
jgi:glycosyltransferase involved in cell wall biosynthesis